MSISACMPGAKLDEGFRDSARAIGGFAGGTAAGNAVQSGRRESTAAMTSVNVSPV